MSIKHLNDLPSEDLIKVAMAHEWVVMEKFDGSFIGLGLTKDGIPYTYRKHEQRFFNVDDWPDKPWTNYFKSAHVALVQNVHLFVQAGIMQNGDEIGFELLPGRQPNSVIYDKVTDDLILTVANRPTKAINGVEIKSTTDFIVSDDGIDLSKTLREIKWTLRSPNRQYVNPRRTFASVRNMELFLKTLIHYDGYHVVTISDVLGWKANSKSFPKKKVWGSHRKGDILQTRKTLEESRAKLCVDIAEDVIQWFDKHLMFRIRGMREGVVIQSGEVTFKLVQPRSFQKLNLFTHWVKYNVSGGRRPERSNFLSRTKDWDVEAQLERLDQLRRRYIEKREKLTRHINNHKYAYEGELHERTLLMFAELRERILNGRQCI